MSMTLIDFDTAQRQLLSSVKAITQSETLPLGACLGRVLAAEVRAEIDVPPMDNSAMDGYALLAQDTASARADHPLGLKVSQRVAAGQTPLELEPGTAARIFTGAMLPVGADAVVVQEDVEARDGLVLLKKPVVREANVRRRGNDISRGKVVLPAGQRLRAQDLGLLASVGVAQVLVVRKLRVARVATGDELIEPGQPLRAGAIYNSNRFVLDALLQALGCEVSDLGTLPDQLEPTRTALREAARTHDLILSSGGVSVGEEDHIKPAVEAEGSLDLWHVGMKPGRPLAHGLIRRHGEGSEAPCHFIGLPGNPVSAFVTFVLMVRPFLLKQSGAQPFLPKRLRLRASNAWGKPDKRREFLRARVEGDGVEIAPRQESSVMSSTVWANALVDNPGSRVISAGDLVDVLLFDELLH